MILATNAYEGPPRSLVLLVHATWLVLGATFVLLLGGLHPSDARRDAVLLAAATLVCALNAPMALWVLLGRHRAHGSGAEALVQAGWLALRLTVVAGVLSFVHSVSHERQGRPRYDDFDASPRAAREASSMSSTL